MFSLKAIMGIKTKKDDAKDKNDKDAKKGKRRLLKAPLLLNNQ